jgi:flagellin
MITVNTNVSSLNAQNRLSTVSSRLSTHFERLSSGLRINGAKDDAAGLSISTRMNAQVRGTQKAIQNANDNISFTQTAEGALNEVTNILQRMRELTVQASSNILNVSDRESIQGELTQLSSEINRINESSTFNGKQIFSQHKTISTGTSEANPDGFNITYDLTNVGPAGSVATAFQESWLREGVERVEQYYGIKAKGRNLTIDFTSGQPFAGQVAQTGDDLTLTIDTDDVGADDNGFTVAMHEIAHAVMFAADVDGSTWWMEGTAQFMEDGESILKAQVDASSEAAIAAQDIGTWDGSLDHYASAYGAIRYLHEQIKLQGNEDGVKAMMSELSAGGSLDDALGVAGYVNEASFLADWAAKGEAFIGTMDLENEDIGIIGGYDADKGAIVTRADIVSGIKLFENAKEGGIKVNMHIGSSSADTLSMTVGSFNTSALNLNVEVIDFADTDGLLRNIDIALDQVSKQRSTFGAMQNRLESTINSLQVFEENTSESRSRITDADFASETAGLTSAQIIQQASTAVLSQANTNPQLALALL